MVSDFESGTKKTIDLTMLCRIGAAICSRTESNPSLTVFPTCLQILLPRQPGITVLSIHIWHLTLQILQVIQQVQVQLSGLRSKRCAITLLSRSEGLF